MSEVRKAKRKVEGSLDPADVKKAKDELREAQKNVRDHINKTNADEGTRVLVRKPLQEKIYGETPPRIGSSADLYEPPKKPVQSSEAFAAEVSIPAPENQTVEYTDQKIPERLKSAGVEQNKAVEPAAEVEAGNVNNQSIDNSEESSIINKKIRFYSINEEYDNLYTEEEIEAEMQKSPIGRYISECVENDGYSIEMNYDANAPLYECGTIYGKNISVNVINHSDAADIAETIIHETAHKKFNWDVTQEDEVNCRIYEYLHSHETISEDEIKSIVDFVREKYSEDPEGDLYGY